MQFGWFYYEKTDCLQKLLHFFFTLALRNKVCIIHCNHVNLYDDYIGCVLKKKTGFVVLSAALREEHYKMASEFKSINV